MGAAMRQLRPLPLFFALILLGLGVAPGQEPTEASEVLSVENVVDVAPASGAYARAAVGQNLAVRDRLRTGEESRAAVRLADASILRVDELTETEILPPREAAGKPTLNVKQGAAYFFSREQTREVQVQTPAANGAIRGTEFVVRVAAGGKTSFVMLDGELELSNGAGLGPRAGWGSGGGGTGRRAAQDVGPERDQCHPVVPLLSGRARFEGDGVFVARTRRLGRFARRV